MIFGEINRIEWEMNCNSLAAFCDASGLRRIQEGGGGGGGAGGGGGGGGLY